MYPYLPHTKDDIKVMLDTIGIESLDDLFTDIPENIRFDRNLNLQKAKSELEVTKIMKDLANENKPISQHLSFLGGGAYQHYIPSIIKHLVMRQEFLTAYTPYQPEMSQGTLQAIFEYQTMICQLTGMDVSNASLYDGGTSMAEAVFMASHANKKKDVLVSKTVHPDYRQVVETYAYFNGLNYIEIDEKDGVTNLSDLKEKYSKDTSSIVVQNPNYYGLIEDSHLVKPMMDQIRTKAQLIVSVNPISLGLLEAPGHYGADIVVGEGQALGSPVQFGGPYLGFIASTKGNMRRMPGRIVGQTLDKDGKRAFVLTLQAREQHIRREKAMSNITSNEGLVALMATIYLALMGKKGLVDVAKQSLSKAHYLADKLGQIEGIDIYYKHAFFNEFVIGVKDAKAVKEKLLEKDIYIGQVLDDKRVLIAVTEVHQKNDLDRLIKELGGVLC